MRQEYIIFSLPSDNSGVPLYSLELARTLKNASNVCIYTGRNSGIFGKQEDINHRTTDIKNDFSIFNFVNAMLLFRRIKKQNPHTRLVLQGSLFIYAAKLSGVLSSKDFCIYHGIPFDNGVSFLQRSIMWCLAHIDKFIKPKNMNVVLTEKNYSSLERFVVPEKIRVLPNFSRLNSISNLNKSQGRKLLVIAGFRKQKNYSYLLKLFDGLDERFTLTICGPGTDTTKFWNLVERNVRKDRQSFIRILGSVDDVYKQFVDHDIYIQTSHYEGMSLSALEARAMGLKLALSDTSGTEELLGSWCGVKLELNLPDDVRALQNLAQMQFVPSPKEVTRFSIENFRKNVLNIFGS